MIQPMASVSELKTLHAALVEIHDGVMIVKDKNRLEQPGLEQLAVSCVLGDEDVAALSRQMVWDMSQYMGCPYASPYQLIDCLIRDDNGDLNIPILEAEWIPFPLLEIVLEAAGEMEVGPLLFSLDLGTSEYLGHVCRVLCAAMKTRWQAPVLFFDSRHTLSMETRKIDWLQKMRRHRDDVSDASCREIVAAVSADAKLGIDSKTARAMMRIPASAWQDVKSELFDAFCDDFEETDSNETFSLIKRYLIPAGRIRFEDVRIVLGT